MEFISVSPVVLNRVIEQVRMDSLIGQEVLRFGPIHGNIVRANQDDTGF